jgi:acetylornithine deacetylase/succinyl-diaminopimelate desuccinylase-like protein
MKPFSNLYHKHVNLITADYLTLLRFRSISADLAYRDEVRACSSWVADHLRSSGFEVQVWETPGNPTIYGERLTAGAGRPTLLLYGHYDVQPVDPVEEWTSPPFEPRVERGVVYARGAQDNKGQLMYVLAALRALADALPLNVKVCVEGEEEIGSPGLAHILPEVSHHLKAETLLVVDSGIPKPDLPSITLGVRGIAALSISLRGSKMDLHSGLFGGAAYNPNRALVEMLAQLRGPDGRVQIPGFYDSVRELLPEERQLLSLDWDMEASRTQFGVEPGGGEQGYSVGEWATMRPTVEINGLSGGYSGPGFKTVIPAVASAKISCRLVPDQDPELITQALEQFLRSHLPKGIEMKVEDHHGGLAVRTSPNSPAVKALSQAFETVFNKPCQFALMGGSIPISALLAKAAGAQPLFCGLGLPDDNIHAPNERFDMRRIEMGFEIICHFLTNYASTR